MSMMRCLPMKCQTFIVVLEVYTSILLEIMDVEIVGNSPTQYHPQGWKVAKEIEWMTKMKEHCESSSCKTHGSSHAQGLNNWGPKLYGAFHYAWKTYEYFLSSKEHWKECESLDLIPMAHQICSNFKSIATCSSLVTCWCIFIKSHNWLKFLICRDM